MEKQLGPNVVTLGYVGNAGRRLPATININQPTTSANIYPIASEPGVMANLVESIGVSSYNAMQVLYSRRFNNGLSANMNYTWAHQLNDVATFGEGPVNYACVRYGCEVDNPWTGGTDIANGLRYDWGNGDSDARHRFNTMLSYQEPFGKNMRGVKGAVVKGWGLSGSGRWGTGTPFSVSNSRGLSGISGVMSDRPNMISNPMKAGNVTLPGGSTCVGPSKLGSPIGGVKYGFNPCAFAYQTAGTLGNERRNQLFGPHSWSMNAALAKDFPVTEKASISFRAEAFNVTNTHPDTTPGSSLGNDLTYAIESSGVQPGRQVQFDLKLKF
jgi:hypothetical protein